MTSPIVEHVSSPPELGNPLRIWNVARLSKLAEDLPVLSVDLSSIRDLQRVGWYGDPEQFGRLTVREVAEHARRIFQADLEVPVLLSADGFVFDGLHRVAKAWMEGRGTILAKQFEVDPDPDSASTLPEWFKPLYLDNSPPLQRKEEDS